MKFIPWRVYTWVCKRFGFCWASMVELKLYGLNAWLRDHEGSAWSDMFPSRSCFLAHPNPYDYCGWYDNSHPMCPKDATYCTRKRWRQEGPDCAGTEECGGLIEDGACSRCGANDVTTKDQK